MEIQINVPVWKEMAAILKYDITEVWVVQSALG